MFNNCYRFKQVASLGNKIVDVHAGGMHSVALDSDGKVSFYKGISIQIIPITLNFMLISY